MLKAIPFTMDAYKPRISKVNYKLYEILNKYITYITNNYVFSKYYQKQLFMALNNINNTKDDIVMISKLCLFLKFINSKINHESLIDNEEYKYFTYIYKHINFYDDQQYENMINSIYIMTYLTKFISYFCQKYISFGKYIKEYNLNIEILELILAFIEYDKYNYSTDIKLKNTNITDNVNVLNYITYKTQGINYAIDTVEKLTDINTIRVVLPESFINMVKSDKFNKKFYKMHDKVFNHKIIKLYNIIDNGIEEDSDSEYDNLSDISNYEDTESIDEENDYNEEEQTSYTNDYESDNNSDM